MRRSKKSPLIRKFEFRDSNTMLRNILLKRFRKIFKIFLPDDEADKLGVLKMVIESFPPTKEIFTANRVHNPLLPLPILRNVMDFYKVRTNHLSL